mgnify:CR=1 FL=1
MSKSSHLQSLRKKHQNLSLQVKDIEQDSAFDSMAVAELKKQKLRLKDMITSLELEIESESDMSACYGHMPTQSQKVAMAAE